MAKFLLGTTAIALDANELKQACLEYALRVGSEIQIKKDWDWYLHYLHDGSVILTTQAPIPSLEQKD